VTCARCHGLLVEIPSLVWLSGDDYQPTQSDQCEGEAWQCLNCGNYIDGVILANRLSPPQPPFEEEAAVSAAVNLDWPMETVVVPLKLKPIRRQVLARQSDNRARLVR